MTLSFFFSQSSFVRADDSTAYVTLVNPIRGRSIWKDIGLLKPQIQMIVDKKLPATWLVQYEVLQDEELLSLLKNLPKTHEIGLFLEVDETLATDSLVPYLQGVGDWARADKVLLSGYLPAERKRMIDTAFWAFQKQFGFYPTSVGSWYIDTLSLDYARQKFGIRAALNVADQFQTDSYGIWGTPWGVPYFSSFYNSLLPSKNAKESSSVVMIQWALRDPVYGFGKTTFDSTYSVQANDYIGHHNLTSSYFHMLARSYLFSQNPLAHLTIGLEGGQEGVSYTDELKKQIEILEKFQNEKNITFVTMKDFADHFITTYSQSSPNFFIEGKDRENPLKRAFWFTTPFYRIGLLQDGSNLKLRDLRIYSKQMMFSDIGDRDTNKILKRIIPPCIIEASEETMPILMKEIDKIESARNGDEIIMKVTKKDKSENILILRTSDVEINGSILFTTKEKIPLNLQLHSLIASFLLSYELHVQKTALFGLRFASINNTYYMGIMIEKDKLMGVQTKFPFLGIFEFPFQVLTRFRTIPQFSITRLLSHYFIPEVRECTITL